MINNTHAEPLSDGEQKELSEKLAKLPPSTARELRAGVECLPKGTRDRALYDWAKRTNIPTWYRP